MEEWPLQTIGDFVATNQISLQTGPFGAQLHAHDYLPTGVAVIPTEGIRDKKIDLSVLPRISEAKAIELSRHRLLEGDILFARRGVQATGRTAIITKDETGFICGTGAIRLRVIANSSPVDARFLAHLLSDEASIAWFKFHAIGATMPNLNEGIIRSFTFRLPPKSEQLAIAELLSALDDKIELNRRMNETLEASARALFRDWFVDFGPTRAKADGRPAYLAPDLWSLFPDRVDNDGVPEGWEWGTVESLADLNSEIWGTRNRPGSVAYVDLSNTKWGYVEKVEAYDWANAPSRARRVLRPGDTIVGTVRPGNGSYAYIAEQGLTGSTGFAVLRPKDLRDRAFIWCAATSPENIERLSHLADGGAYPAVRPDVVARTEIVVPPHALLSAFETAGAALLNQIEANKAESRTLAETRDILLPKLMSGAVRIGDAEATA